MSPDVLARLTPDERHELLALLSERQLRHDRTQLTRYKPYNKQREFHRAGAGFRERLFMAGNQLGKTMAGAAEVAMHLTGMYPDWWDGLRFNRPVTVLAGSESAELTRNGVQRLLLGPPQVRERWGTGAIPHACIESTSPRSGVPDAVSSIVVRHAGGGFSNIQMLSYDQGRTKWQANTVDLVWFDEEPPEDVYFEGLTRTNATGGSVMVTFTPLLGMSSVVKRYITDKAPGTVVTNMTINDAEHYSQEERDRIIASYPDHEREARAMGIPILGSGRVFPVAESGIKIDPFPIPPHWARICGVDFGYDHPAAAAWLAHDRDTDTVYVYDVWRGRQLSVQHQVPIIRSRGSWIPVAWPHDGLQHDKGSGEQLAAQYRSEGLPMLAKRSTFEDGSNGVEAGIAMMLGRMQTRRLRVFSHLNDFWEEFRLYHRKDGKIVKEGDDILAATRYALMSIRHAKTESEVTGSAVAPRAFGGMPFLPAEAPLDPTVGW